MSKQPDALRLAEWLDALDVRTPDRIQNCVSASAELRRLHTLLMEAREALAGGLWDYGPEQDEHIKCDELIAKLDDALGEGETK